MIFKQYLFYFISRFTGEEVCIGPFSSTPEDALELQQAKEYGTSEFLKRTDIRPCWLKEINSSEN